MNRIDRISAMLIQLQSKKVVKGQDIADRFGISLRTVYRDIKTLEEAGVPILSEAGTGYSIMEGYRLPPVMFTKSEAQSFLIADKLVEKLTDPSTHKLYQSALFKIKAVLRYDEKDHIESMAEHIEVYQNPYIPKDQQVSDYIQTILRCIAQKKVLSMSYFANHSQENTSRKIEPVGIFLMAGHWYLIAYCWLRKDYRHFRIDRILTIISTEEAFQKQHRPLKSYLEEITKEKRELHTVVMKVEKSVLKHMGEQKFYMGFVSQKTVDNQIEMTFLSSSLEGFARWYMMLGDRAEIIQPQQLKSRIKELSTLILKKNK